MDLLRITHDDFILTVESTQFQRMWDKGVSILGGEKLISSYRWSEGVEHVLLVHDNAEREIAKDIADEAVFFEQTDYSVWVDFKKKVTKAWFDSPRKDVNDRFSWKESKQLLAGYLNYGNEIGRADMPICYTIDGVQKRFVFSYDVISAKLDYHHDWKIILQDIEAEYRMLSLDYLKRTYHGIKEEQGESYDIIWWNIFGGLQEQFLRTVHNIIDRPRHRLKSIETYKRADQIRRLTPQLEQQLAEHRTEETRLYRVEEQQNTYNTPENRFLKHALLTVQKRYATLSTRVLQQEDGNLSESKKKEIADTRDELTRLSRHPFFRTVGPFDGIKQESLILQKDVNYSKVFRIFTILQKSFSLNDGLYRMETKDIATLYEIWCFIQVEKVVKELTDTEPEQQSRTEMSGLFSYSLGKGEHSKIIFKKDDVTLAELVYNPRHSDKDDIKGIGELESKTVPQKPDIVLQLTKDDLQEGMKLTYLFDAKYRLEKDGANDVPPDDAINQMHRYRDAIYYNNKHHDEKIKKEVIGGYILFPGRMDEASRFRRSIDEVNIGAFPMRPGDNQHELLSDFIKDLLNKHAVEIVEQVIPQKGTTLEVKNRVLIGVVKPDNSQYASFLNGTAASYYSGVTFPTTIPLDGMDYFAPYIPDKGIRDLYLVTGIHTSTKVKGSEDDKLRITFDLKFARQLFADYKMVSLPIQHAFNDTSLDILTVE